MLDDYNQSLERPWIYYPIFMSIKELVTVLIIVNFVLHGVAQMMPLIVFSIFTIFVIAVKRPYNNKMTNILSLISEIAFLLIFIGFLVLTLTKNTISGSSRARYIGWPLIAMVFVIVAKCVVEYVFFLIQFVKKVISY